MISVRVRESRISVSGHAGQAPKGQDIVCAAVSALTLTLILGLNEVAGMDVKSQEAAGNVCIEWQNVNDTGKALIDTWYLGMCRIAQSYDNYIQFI